jgi:signal transduction histidine kinase
VPQEGYLLKGLLNWGPRWEAIAMETLRVDRDLGNIELGVIDYRTLAVVSAPARFYSWINRSANERVVLTDIITDVTAEDIYTALDSQEGICDLESVFKAESGEEVILRLRLHRTGASPVSPLRLIVLDISELRRKEEILRTVSDLLEKHKAIISESRKNLKELLDTLPQAVLMIDSKLQVISESSTRIEEVFGKDVFRKSLMDIMGLSEKDCESLILAFSGLRWDLLRDAAPKEWRSGDSLYAVSFIPRYENERMVSMTVVFDDITEERRIQDSLVRVDAENRTLLAILGAQEEFFDLVDLAQRAVINVGDPVAFRSLVHDLKGGFSLFDCPHLISVCHEAETDWKNTGYTEEKARRFLSDLNHEIKSILDRFQDSISKPSYDYEMENVHRELRVDYRNFVEVMNQAQRDRVSPALLDSLEALARRPVSGILGWLDKVWDKTLRAEGKLANSIVFKGDVRLPREPYKHLFQTFVHIIRNAADHGIERPESRRQSGKSPEGNMEIRCSCVDDMYEFTFRDDGEGIDPNKIISLARDRGIDVSDGISRDEAFLLLCEPELSSKSTATELSGRGEGLYAVQQAARSFGGELSIQSECGKGTKVTVRFKRRPHCI